MATKVLYYFCENCGGDTASYELTSTCPYCGSNRPEFHLIGEAVAEGKQEEIQQTLITTRAHWISAQKPASLKSKRHRKNFLL